MNARDGHGCLDSRDYFVYWLYDTDGELVYIGRTHDPRKRWQQHHHERPGMVAAAASYRLAGPYAWHVAWKIEARAIVRERPLFNRDITNTLDGILQLAEKYPAFQRQPREFKRIIPADRARRLVSA